MNDSQIVLKPKLLIWDVEVSPMLSWHWRTGEQYMRADQIKQRKFLLTISWQWYGTPAIFSVAVTPEEALARDDSRLVRIFAEELRKADYFIYHNGDRFDNKLFNSRLLHHGMQPVGEKKSFDTLKLARRYFSEDSNKLDDLAQLHMNEKKLDTSFKLWLECMKGDQDAIDRMAEYNKHDVRLTNTLFDKLKPYVKIKEKIAYKTAIDGQKVDTSLDKYECNHCGSVGKARISSKYKSAAGNIKFFVRCKVCDGSGSLNKTFKEAAHG